jgi:hypothetical protein
MTVKDMSRDLRRTGRGRLASRVRNSNRQRLSELLGEDGRPLYGRGRDDQTKAAHQKAREHTNWRVRTEFGEVIAIEPNREYEHVFTDNADDFMTALEYAAKQLREGSADDRHADNA